MTQKIGIIIQARVGSTRLPNKVLTDISGSPLLKHVVKRCEESEVDQIIIATSINKENDSLEEFCIQNNYPFFRGSENNVLNRFYETAKKFRLDIIIRITGDCPLISPEVINLLIKKFKENDLDYVSNAAKRSFPRGLDCEIFSFNALEKAHNLAKEEKDFEHVTPFIYGNPNLFKIGHLLAEKKLNHSEIRLCVDTLNDLKLIKEIYKNLYSGDTIPIDSVINFLLKNPNLIEINKEEEIFQQTQNLEQNINQKIQENKEIILRPVNSEDIDFLFDLRNKKYVYEPSINPNPITYQEHLNWISPIINGTNKKRLLFVVIAKGEKTGQIRFDILDKNVSEVSISFLKEHHGAGIANFALKKGIDIMKKLGVTKILAEIFENNISSIKFFEKHGFTFLKDITSNLKLYEFLIKNEMKIGNKIINENSPTLIVAELSANHNQDLDIAIKTIKSAKAAGADAIKIQTYTPDTMTIDCNKEFFQINQGTLWDGENLYSLYKKAYTPWGWHETLKKITEELGMLFFSTPFDKTSVDFLENLKVPCYKIASFEITDLPLIKYVASKGKPIIISTGIAKLEEIEDAINVCKKEGNDQIILLKCTSSYPAPLEESNLKNILYLKEKFNTIIGLSDHTLGISAPLTAVALGAKIIEKHFIIDKKIGGPDSEFSLEPLEFEKMVKGIRGIEKLLGKKEYQFTEKMNKGRKFSRSIFAVKNIIKGDLFNEENIRIIRPGDGLAPKNIYNILGKKAKKDIDYGTPLSWDLIEN